VQADVERLWARLLTDKDARAQFFAEPERVATEHGLSPAERDALLTVSRQDLMTASRSYAHKNAMNPKPRGWWTRLARLLRRVG
jgi:hypothetical protein